MATILDLTQDDFKHIVYGVPDTTTWQFLESHNRQMTERLSEAGMAWVESIPQYFNTLSLEETFRQAQAAIRKVSGVFERDDIHALLTLGALQQAKPVMQRYIMALPELRRVYLDQSLRGYEGSYQNLYGNAIGENHYDYRRVMDGVIQFTTEGECFSKQYLDDLKEGEEPLTVIQHYDIELSWRVAKRILLKGEEDLTDTDNGML